MIPLPHRMENAEYLIITRDMFLNALQPLVDLKSQRMSVKVVTVENIMDSAESPEVALLQPSADIYAVGTWMVFATAQIRRF